MSVESPNTEPGFFGKDSFVPFIGQVEDTNDPKRSNRVKVRCVGWHPLSKTNDGKDEDALSTEDLPWAKVGMPTTMAQQGRTGGKHGLKVGSWVFGFFMDGYDAQDPFVLNSFNFTAKTTEKNNRKKVDAPDGTMPSENPAFAKTDSKKQKSDGTTTEKEQGGEDDPTDLSHDTTLEDSTDGECIISRSAASKLKDSKKSKQNMKGQPAKIVIADGLCGAAKNAKDQISNKMEEIFPPGISRFVYNDDVWDALTGNHINLNGLFNLASQEIGSLLRGSIQTEKGNIEKLINKALHGASVLSGATRDEITAITIDISLSTSGDIWHNSFSELVLKLAPQVLQSIQNINNQQQAPKGQNNTSNTGSTAGTIINDVSCIQITDAIITDVEQLFDKVVEETTSARDEYMKGKSSEVEDLKQKILDTIPEDLECGENIQDSFNPEPGGGDNGGGDSGGVEFLDLLTQFDFLKNPRLFNKSGILGVLDQITQTGCKVESMFSTQEGSLGAIAGVSATITAGGSESGLSSKVDAELYTNIKFGGLSKDTNNSPSYEPIDDDAVTEKIQYSVRRDALNNLKRWEPVDLHEPGVSYVLKGEQLFGSIKSNNSRVLITNQSNPRENGIYITSPGEWVRAKDANTPTSYKNKKYITIPKPNIEDRYYVYTGINNPRLNDEPLQFNRLFYK